MKSRNAARFLVGIVVAGLAVAGCGNSTGSAAPGSGSVASTTAATPGARNEADVTFVQNMVAHHRQAIQMVELAPGSTENPEVLDLAARIGAAQGPELDTMTGWLDQWGADVPAEDGSMAGMDHSSMSGMAGMSGMMTPEQMQQLGSAPGPAFDRMFLEMMKAHHAGAVDMARTVLQDGADPQVQELAEAISTNQQKEITEMESLLEQG